MGKSPKTGRDLDSHSGQKGPRVLPKLKKYIRNKFSSIFS